MNGLGLAKTDKRVRARIAELYGANAKQVGGTKKILDDKTPALATLLKHRRFIRTTFLGMTGPWQDDGFRVCTTKGYGNFRAVIDELIDRHGDMLEDVIKVFNDMKEAAKQQDTGLGDLYDESLYPEAEALRGIYTVMVETEVLPDRTNTVLDLDDERAKAIIEEATALTEKRTKDLAEHTHEVIVDRLTHMVEALREYGDDIPGSKRGRTFRDSLVSNMADLSDLLKALNVTGSSKLDKLSSDIAAKLTTANADTLRGRKVPGDKRTDEEREAEASKLREQTADTAEELLDDLADIFGGEG